VTCRRSAGVADARGAPAPRANHTLPPAGTLLRVRPGQCQPRGPPSAPCRRRAPMTPGRCRGCGQLGELGSFSLACTMIRSQSLGLRAPCWLHRGAAALDRHTPGRNPAAAPAPARLRARQRGSGGGGGPRRPGGVGEMGSGLQQRIAGAFPVLAARGTRHSVASALGCVELVVRGGASTRNEEQRGVR
jgi:hypothetical protein